MSIRKLSCLAFRLPVLLDEAESVAVVGGLQDDAERTTRLFANGSHGAGVAVAEPWLGDSAGSSSRQLHEGCHAVDTASVGDGDLRRAGVQRELSRQWVCHGGRCTSMSCGCRPACCDSGACRQSIRAIDGEIDSQAVDKKVIVDRHFAWYPKLGAQN